MKSSVVVVEMWNSSKNNRRASFALVDRRSDVAESSSFEFGLVIGICGLKSGTKRRSVLIFTRS